MANGEGSPSASESGIMRPVKVKEAPPGVGVTRCHGDGAGQNEDENEDDQDDQDFDDESETDIPE